MKIKSPCDRRCRPTLAKCQRQTASPLRLWSPMHSATNLIRIPRKPAPYNSALRNSHTVDSVQSHQTKWSMTFWLRYRWNLKNGGSERSPSYLYQNRKLYAVFSSFLFALPLPNLRRSTRCHDSILWLTQPPETTRSTVIESLFTRAQRIATNDKYFSFVSLEQSYRWFGDAWKANDGHKWQYDSQFRCCKVIAKVAQDEFKQDSCIGEHGQRWSEQSADFVVREFGGVQRNDEKQTAARNTSQETCSVEMMSVLRAQYQCPTGLKT